LAISRAKKEELVQLYVDQLRSSEAIIVTDYRGLTVPDVQQLRGKIREAEGSFVVVKNTLFKRALEEAGLPALDDLLVGPVGVGFCQQNIPGVAKAVMDFSKEHDLFGVKGGMMNEKFVDEAAIKSLASLPSLEVLRAQILGLLNAPASQLVGVVTGGVRQMVNVLNAYAEKGDEASAEA